MRRIISLLYIALLLSGCRATDMVILPTVTSTPFTPAPTVTAYVTPAPATHTPLPPTSTATPTATPKPQQIVVCGQHPTALNPYTPSQSGYDILAFMYTFPVEQEAYKWVPRLLTHIPDFGSGDVVTRSVSVQQGNLYVDTDGTVRTYSRSVPLTLTQMIVTYTLQANLKWSDARPLTAKDVIFGYTVAQMTESASPWRDLAERTKALTAVDDLHVRWEGLPGFTSANYPGFLFPPQPSHKWQNMNLVEILNDRNPPGNGPYRIAVWEEDTSITLEANPYFIGQTPLTENIVVRFPDTKSSFGPDMIKNGTCDILLPESNGDNSEQWLKLENEELAVLWSSPSYTVLRLDFNISPPDNRPNPLSSSRTRLGLANCVSRENLLNLSPAQEAIPAVSFIPPFHPADNPSSVWRVPFSLEVGQGVLDEIGWRDEDDDGIREAHEVEDIRDGTPLTLTLTASTTNRPAAEILAADFRKCGVGIIIDTKGPQQFYAASSVSPLYTRDFQLALYGWQVNLPDGCSAWLSDHFPPDSSIGDEVNYGGYQNPVYDALCRQALSAVGITQQYQALHDAQVILAEDQATLFLTWQPRWLVSQPDIQGIIMDISAFGRLSHPEGITKEID